MGSGAQSYAYAGGTNRLASVTDTSGTRSIGYDGRGNTSSETRPGSIGATASYDGYGRLTGYSRSDTGTHSYAYNGLDDRVEMTLPAGTRRFVYDADGRVMGEYGASAADVKAEFIWALPQVGGVGAFGGDDGTAGYAPLVVATPDSGGTIQLNWVHANHLGVPLVVTDATGAAATTPNDYLLPGFPGQSRVIADLYYNRYRDYDPTSGRYIQADPIGLDGGSNPYLYAGANPVNATDPMGLAPGVVIGGAIRGVGGAAAAGAVGGAIRNYLGPAIGGVVACVLVFDCATTPDSPSAPVRKPAIPDASPTCLCEQLALAEAKAGAGNQIQPKPGRRLGDEPRLIAHYGPGPWVKMQHKHRCYDGRLLVIHYFSNRRGINVELKFINSFI